MSCRPAVRRGSLPTPAHAPQVLQVNRVVHRVQQRRRLAARRSGCARLALRWADAPGCLSAPDSPPQSVGARARRVRRLRTTGRGVTVRRRRQIDWPPPLRERGWQATRVPTSGCSQPQSPAQASAAARVLRAQQKAGAAQPQKSQRLPTGRRPPLGGERRGRRAGAGQRARWPVLARRQVSAARRPAFCSPCPFDAVYS